MLNFQYKGISYGKYVEGEIEALNNSEAEAELYSVNLEVSGSKLDPSS